MIYIIFTNKLFHYLKEKVIVIWGVIRSGFLRVGGNEAKSVCL